MRNLLLFTLFAAAAIVTGASSDEGSNAEINYKTYCVQCHGVGGSGFGINSSAMSMLPRKHNDPKGMSELGDDRIFKAIKGGGLAVASSPLMPSWGATLTDREISEIVIYLRKLCGCKPKQ